MTQALAGLAARSVGVGVGEAGKEASAVASTPGFSRGASAFSRYLVQGKTRTGNHVAMETREALPDRGENKHNLAGLNPHEPRVASPPGLRGPGFHWKHPVACPPRAVSTRAEWQLQPTQESQGQCHPRAAGESHFFAQT